MHTIERYHDISVGHRVHGHESKCAHLHGHNYRITFTCAAAPVEQPARRYLGQPDNLAAGAGELDNLGRVIDFSVVKKELCMWLEEKWDHKFLLWNLDPLLDSLLQLDKLGVVPVPFNPTAENMAEFLVNVVGPMQLRGTGVVLVSCKVEETRKCSATYTAGR